MKQRIIFIFKYFAFWICMFFIAKVVFLLYENNQSFELTPGTWIRIFTHGFKMDLSMAGYLTVLPALILTFTSYNSYKPVFYIINIYTSLIIIIFLLITFTDLEAYKYWGTRLDITPLRFLAKPKEALASTNIFTLVIYLVSFVLVSFLLYKLYKKFIASSLIKSKPSKLPGIIVSAFLTSLLFIPIRGGFGVSPVNTGSVYFSKIAFANHAAINVIWNFGQSALEKKESVNPYIFTNNSDYSVNLNKLYNKNDNSKELLKNNRPNIIIVILESFTAKLIEPLGGAKGVTPRFNELTNYGINFSNIYSSDSRTDKGIATVISGYPVLESIPIMKYPEKTQNLPFLSHILNKNGYHSSFTYGGDIDFANIRSYLINGGFSKITSDEDFPASLRTGKWGVPDNYVFDRFLENLKADTGLWFNVMLTLTNHEPFELPVKPKFGNKTLTEKFYSSAYYADSCIGDFIKKLKSNGLWENTLIIFVADHGSRLPGFDNIFEPRKHHIPLLWTGGAVLKDTTVTKIGSQADIAVTLLNQLNLPTSGFFLGKDLLSPSSQSFAFYSIKNGIAMLTDSSGFAYDFTTNDLSFSYGKSDSAHISLAKFYQQYVFQNYLDLSGH